MLEFNDLAIRRGARVLFEHATFAVPGGRRVGVIGANGSGKSSLFQLILGEIEADAGGVTIAGAPVVAHVAQHLAVDGRDGLEHTLDGDAELRAIERRLDGGADAALLARYEEIGGYGARARAARLLAGLGFDEARMGQAADTLSGGWRMRISLARALMCRSDLLLLDEPTNHLDLDAVIWLEGWLRSYPGTLLLISHDREFLDRVVDTIVAIEGGRVTAYSGNYSAYEETRAARLAVQDAAYRKQQREIAHMRSFVDRFRAKASKARQAQSRLKALERMERIAPAHVDSPFSFSFRVPEALPAPLLRLVDAAVGYEGTAVLQDVNLSLAPGDRIGLLGLNGAGKSTLSRLIAGRLALMAGEAVTATRLARGYFAQSQLELLDDDETPAEHFRRVFGLADEQAMRNFLGGFGFGGERVFERVAPFSGGEKARLVLAMVVYSRPNLLILDEPTNHLDIDMRHALTSALQEFDGAVVLVSHDRHLLRATADELWLVDGGRVAPFDGELDDYPAWLASRRRDDEAPRKGAAVSRRDLRRRDADRRAALKPLTDRVRRLERRLDSLGRDGAALDARLADNALYEEARKDELTELLRRRAALRAETERAEEEMLEAMEQLEEAGAGGETARA